jgi:DNA-binding transcriptional LysR family regulator
MAGNRQKIDLRLLTVFAAVWDERSVSRAANRLGVSQSAISNSLNRLRKSLNDHLFVPGPQGMNPTERAREIAEPIRFGLKCIGDAIDGKIFDPCSEWTFRVAISDQASIIVLPRLLKLLRKTSPTIRLQVSSKRNVSIYDKISLGEVDVGIGVIPEPRHAMTSDILFQDRYVCLMRKNHALANNTITRKIFSEAEHLALRSSHDDSGQIERTLAEWGVTRRIVVNVGQLTAFPSILETTDLLACVPQSVGRVLVNPRLAIVPLPFQGDLVNIVACWSPSRAYQPEIKWLRSKLKEVSQDLIRCDAS